MSQVSNQILRRISRSSLMVIKRSETAAGTMLSHVCAGISAMTSTSTVVLPAIASLVATFHPLNAKRATADTNRHASIAVREIVVTSATRLTKTAAQTT